MQRTATFLMKRLNSLANIAQSAAVPADAGSQLSPDIQIKDEIQQSQNRTRAVFARLKALTEEAARVESNEKELKEALIVMAKDKEISDLQRTALAQSTSQTTKDRFPLAMFGRTQCSLFHDYFAVHISDQTVPHGDENLNGQLRRPTK